MANGKRVALLMTFMLCVRVMLNMKIHSSRTNKGYLYRLTMLSYLFVLSQYIQDLLSF